MVNCSRMEGVIQVHDLSTGYPKVSVLLAVRNGEEYVESAVRSVMDQTLRDLEILIVDDCSEDNTPSILSRLASEDPRIRVERLARNLRLPGALNHGLDLVRGSYVARMDADDLCEPDRLERQVAFLEAHPQITLVGCSTHHIDGEGHVFKTSIRSQDPYAARWMCRFIMPFRHPTFLFRRTEMAERYDATYSVSEDYDILARLSSKKQIACMPDVLLRYREHGGSLTGNKWATMLNQARQIAERVQREDLDADIYAGLECFRAAYFDAELLNPMDTMAFFAGLRKMAWADSIASPLHRAWIWSQTAQLAMHALERNNTPKSERLKAFLGRGRDFLSPLVLRALEVKQALPNKLRSEAQFAA